MGIEIHQFAAGGMKTAYSDSNGLAKFELNVDDYAQITVYANGNEKVSRGSIKAEYTVVV